MGDSFEDFKMIKAVDVISKKNDVVKLKGKFRTVWDQSMTGLTWDNLEEALNILGEYGWRPVTSAISEKNSRIIYVILERVN